MKKVGPVLRSNSTAL